MEKALLSRSCGLKAMMKIAFSAISLAWLPASGIAGELNFTTNYWQSNLKESDRQSVNQTPLIFPRSQPQYGLYQNFLDSWVDRPLFFNRAYRDESAVSPFLRRGSIIRELDIVKSYEVNGLALLAGYGGSHLKMYEFIDAWLKEIRPEGFVMLPEFTSFEGNRDIKMSDFLKVLRIAIKSPYSAKINGKVLISSYRVGSPEQLKEIITNLKKEVGDNFLFLPDLAAVLYSQGELYCKMAGKISPEADKIFRNKLQSYLDCTDGLYFAITYMSRKQEGEYSTRINEDFAYKYLVPVILETMNKPQNKGKLLGMSAMLGHTNFLLGPIYGEYGTETLRKSLELAAAVKPDIIILPEWNEFNENTCIQPTVYNSLSTQRILKYYSRKLKGLAPTPNPGDNLKIPNLVLSYQREIKLGELLQFELLNIPDSTIARNYSAQLSLKSPDGKILRQFPAEKFIADKMTAVTYTVPSEQLVGCQAVIPVLEITGYGKEAIKAENFLYLKINPTVCWIYKNVRQPLRDMLIPEKSTFEVRANPDGTYNVNASLSAGEKLASLELLDNGFEVFAADPKNEFDRDDDEVIMLSWTSWNINYLTGKITARNVPSVKFFHAGVLNPAKIEKNEIMFQKLYISIFYRRAFLAIPKKNVESAILDFDFDIVKFQVPVKTIIEQGLYGKEFGPGDSFIRLERWNKLPDIPYNLNSAAAAFACTVKSDYKFPVYHLRAITESGKIYNSAPKIVATPDGKTVKLEVFSETAGKPVRVELKSDMIPDLKYIFNPDCGDIMKNSYERFFDAELGGGFRYPELFNMGDIPKNIATTSPQWIKSGNEYVLQFNGLGNYINLPRETLPRGSFTLEFELKLDGSNNQILFRHGDKYNLGSISLTVKQGKLCAVYLDMMARIHNFASEIDIPAGEWCKVKIVRTLRSLTLGVNNQSKTFPLNERALYFKPSVFGGTPRSVNESQARFFKGQLKSLRIIHNAE